MISSRCIWCHGPAGGNHVEHIIPEALGCPEDFILPSDVICKRCNNGLGHLDRAVAQDFDFITFQAGVPRKNGRPPAIDSRGNVYGFRTGSHSHIHFNMGAESTTAPDGATVGGFKGKERNIRAEYSEHGPFAKVSFKTEFAASRKFQRGIYKIALSALVHFVGPEELFKPKYDGLRQYVRDNKGERHLMLLVDDGVEEYRHHFPPPMKSPEGDFGFEFRLACVRFIVEFSESESFMPKFEAAAQDHIGEKGWTVVPVE